MAKNNKVLQSLQSGKQCLRGMTVGSAQCKKCKYYKYGNLVTIVCSYKPKSND